MSAPLCSTCRGTGRITVNQPVTCHSVYGLMREMRPVPVPCPDCDGVNVRADRERYLGKLLGQAVRR